MSIHITIALAVADGVELVQTTLETGATVEEAIRASGLAARHPGGLGGSVGIYGKLVPPSQELRDGDRIEIYRPLQADPKAVRRARAKKR